jgi:hypothetical protein
MYICMYIYMYAAHWHMHDYCYFDDALAKKQCTRAWMICWSVKCDNTGPWFLGLNFNLNMLNP